jgi:hypothetical protein
MIAKAAHTLRCCKDIPHTLYAGGAGERELKTTTMRSKSLWQWYIKIIMDFLDILNHPIFFIYNVLETRLCLHPQVIGLLTWTQLTELVPISGDRLHNQLGQINSFSLLSLQTRRLPIQLDSTDRASRISGDREIRTCSINWAQLSMPIP